MKPNLILGLGNSLMGDDGIGCRIVGLLAEDPRLPPDVEAVCAGTDVLRWAERMEGRRRVILIDALLGDGGLGTIETFEDKFEELESRQSNAHHVSLPHAIRLLQTGVPEVCDVRFTLIGVTIEAVEFRAELSPGLNARVPEIVEFVLGILD
jgi:hydrogenase maturation protease